MNNYSIAVIPGDGIGKEVVPAAQQVVEVAGKRFGFTCKWQSFDWGCETFCERRCNDAGGWLTATPTS